MSRIGRKPVAIPKGVTVEIAKNNKITVKGPRGQLTRNFSSTLGIAEENGEIVVTRPTDRKSVV